MSPTLELEVYTIKSNAMEDNTIYITANLKTIQALLGKTIKLPKEFTK
jgi:hypothetical protein